MAKTETTTDNKLKVFVPLYKVDAAQRLLYGRMAAEELDDANEMFDYASSKPLVQEWSDYINKASGGKSYGNVRAMHGKVAAGRLDDIVFDDDSKAIEICAHIVDDNEWDKVEKGVYTGFSIGGSYVKRWQEGGVKKYTAKPVEVSIVDNPSTKSAFFQFVKMSGESEDRPFIHGLTPSAEETHMPPEPIVIPNDLVVARATELAKASGAAGFADFIGAAREELEKAAKDSPEVPEDTAKDMPKLNKGEHQAVMDHVAASSQKIKDAHAAFKEGAMTESQASALGESLKGSADDACKSAGEKFSAFKVPVAKAAADTTAMTTTTDPRDEVSQKWLAKDGTPFEKKADALAHNLALADPVARSEAAQAAALATLEKFGKGGSQPLAKAAEDDTPKEFTAKDYAHVPDASDKSTWKMRMTKTPGGPPDKGLVNAACKAMAKGTMKMSAAEVDKATAKLKSAWKKANPDKSEDDMPKALMAKAAETQGLEKGLWDVQDFAGAVQQIAWLRQAAEMEAAVEGDNSPVAAQLSVCLSQLATILVSWMGEEVNELIGNPMMFDDAGQPHPMAEAMGKMATGNGLAKAGARHSKEDMAALQAMHDMATKLGASCSGGDMGKSSHALDDVLEKFSATQVQNTRLETALEKATATIESMGAAIARIEAQPAVVPPARFQVIDKTGDGGNNERFHEGVRAQSLLEKMSPDVLATAAIGLIHRSGGQTLNIGHHNTDNK